MTSSERPDDLPERVASLEATFKEWKEGQLRAAEIQATSIADRLEKVNEFRQQLSDQAATFLPRAEYDVNHKALEDKLDIINSAAQKAAGREAGTQQIVGYIVGAGGLILAVISFIVLLLR